MQKTKSLFLKRYDGCIVVFLFFLIAASCSSDDDLAVVETEVEQPESTVENPLPLFSIDTKGSEIVDEPKIAAEFTITEKDEILYSGNMGVEIRGQSSQLFPKKSFGFEFVGVVLSSACHPV